MEIKLLLGDAFKTILVVLRLTAIFAVLPIFGLRSVPVHIKIVVGIVVSLALAMGLRGESVVPVQLDFSMILLAAREVFIGVTLG
jgi:flagellar biosynthesis protein FliR